MTGRLGAGAIVLAAAALGVAGCGGATPATTPRSPTLQTVVPPLSVTVTTSHAVWATVPMGDLHDPLNTFWQVLSSPNGLTGWADDSSATATATNGGVVLSAAGDRLTAGVVPSQGLTFSPLVSSVDTGHSWQSGLLPSGLVEAVSALSVSADGTGVALVTSPDAPSGQGGPGAASTAGREVVTTAAGGQLTAWSPLIDERDLAASAGGRQCGLTAIDAIAPGPLLGASCTGPTVGLLSEVGPGSWALTGPTVAALAGSGATQVLEVEPAAGGLVAVVAGDRPTGAGSDPLVVMRKPAASSTWQAGPALELPDTDTVESIDVGSAGQVAVLEKTGSGSEASEALEMADTPVGSWTAEPNPPTGTAAIAFASGRPVALAVDQATLTVSALDAEGGWTTTDSLQVAIQYGSSN